MRAPPKRIDPANQAPRPLGGTGALNAVRRERRRGGAAHQGGERRRRGRVVSLGPGEGARVAAQGARDGRRSAVLVSDEEAQGSDLVATSRILAAALEREGADLILFGQQSSDSDGAVLWSAVADRLRLPVVSQVAELEVSDGKVKAKRQTEFGYDVIEAPTPAVVAVSDAINDPRGRPVWGASITS